MEEGIWAVLESEIHSKGFSLVQPQFWFIVRTYSVWSNQSFAFDFCVPQIFYHIVFLDHFGQTDSWRPAELLAVFICCFFHLLFCQSKSLSQFSFQLTAFSFHRPFFSCLSFLIYPPPFLYHPPPPSWQTEVKLGLSALMAGLPGQSTFGSTAETKLSLQWD